MILVLSNHFRIFAYIYVSMNTNSESKNINVYPNSIQLQLVEVLKDMTGTSMSQLYVKAMSEYINKRSEDIATWMEGNKKAQ